MALTGFHLRVAQLLGQAVGNEGFALGGGYGLQAHKLSDRASNDLDAYVDKFVPEVFERAERAFVTRLTDEVMLNGATPIFFSRSSVEGASLVCRVERTR